MFYSDLLLGKRSALGKVWEYAHKSSQLSRREVSSVDIAQSVKAIEDPLAPMALRAQGQLLYGVCRVYDGKTKVLMEDAQHAQSKLISTRIQSNNQLSLHSKRAAADGTAAHIMASSAAISLGDRDEFENTQMLNQSINQAFDDFSSHDFSVRLSMSQAMNQSLNQSLNHDISLEQARGSLSVNNAINQSLRFDEFEISGGGFSIDDDIDDAINQSTDQSIAIDQTGAMEPDMYEDQPMADQSVAQEPDQQDQDIDQSINQADQTVDQSIQIEVVRDAEVELARRSVGAILGFDANDIDIDMNDLADLDPVIHPSSTQSNNQINYAEQAGQVDEADQPVRPRPAKRAKKVVQFRLEEDSSARLSDAELKRRLNDPSDLTRDQPDESTNQSTNRRRFAPNVLSSLMHSSVFSAGVEDPLDSFMAELFSVQGLKAAPLSEQELEQSISQADDQSNNQSIDQPVHDHDVSRISNMSDIVGGADIDLGFDEQFMADQSMNQQGDQVVDHVDQIDQIDQIDQVDQVDQMTEQSSNQLSESSLDINDMPIFGSEELAENETIQREQSRLTRLFFSEPQNELNDQSNDDHDDNQSNNRVDAGDFGFRSLTVLDRLNDSYAKSDQVEFDNLLTKDNAADLTNFKLAKPAASLFYQLLVLSQRQAVQCEQLVESVVDPTTGESVDKQVIQIKKGDKFDEIRSQLRAGVAH